MDNNNMSAKSKIIFFSILTLVLSCFICVGCQRQPTLEPDEYIKKEYRQYTLLTVKENDFFKAYLLKHKDAYTLAVFEKDKKGKYSFWGQKDSMKSYGIFSLQREDVTNAVVFLDNTTSKASRLFYKVSASESSYLYVNEEGLANNDTYFIEFYQFHASYNHIGAMELYDINDKSIEPK